MDKIIKIFCVVTLFAVTAYAQIKKKLPLLEMVFVKGGSFQMGDTLDYEKPIHKVTLSDFYIGKYEVTQKQWRAVMGTDPSFFKNCDDCPVENVSWEDIQEFLKKINDQTGKEYRLPTEAEWEYAARGGINSKGYTYSGSNNIRDVAQYTFNSNKRTSTVGSKLANELGIYDMSGNVWEWCEDWYKSYPGSSRENDYTGSRRVHRGGGWAYFPEACRVVNRSDNPPDTRHDSIGFRVALSK